jgi:hypothetical protein
MRCFEASSLKFLRTLNKKKWDEKKQWGKQTETKNVQFDSEWAPEGNKYQDKEEEGKEAIVIFIKLLN